MKPFSTLHETELIRKLVDCFYKNTFFTVSVIMMRLHSTSFTENGLDFQIPSSYGLYTLLDRDSLTNTCTDTEEIGFNEYVRKI